MVSKVNFFNILPNPNSNEHQGPVAAPQTSTSSHTSYNTAQMDGLSRSPFEQGNGIPSTSQPYAPTTQEGTTSNQYPQYSYDIQLRYPQDPNRPSYPQDTARQYDPTRPYPDNVARQYAEDVSRPFPQDIPRQYSQEQVHPYRGEYPPIPIQDQGVPSLPSLSAMTMPGPNQGYGAQQEMAIDTTGQVAPPGMKPRVTATLWEDEGTLCFQVDVKGMCVARREDNHMINGTKLLNVAQMTRGRRDGILKAEKQKHVVKIGPMHLKGVWIPYERALEFANRENITPSLYPLFVHNIGALLYHPINHSRGYPASHVPRRQDEVTTPPLSSPPPSMALGPAPMLFGSKGDGRGGVYS